MPSSPGRSRSILKRLARWARRVGLRPPLPDRKPPPPAAAPPRWPMRHLSGATFILGIGAQRCGTTWLWDYLQSHPQVAMTPLKELHVFDQLFLPGMKGHKGAMRLGALRRQLNARDSLTEASYGDPLLMALTERYRMNSWLPAYLEHFERLVAQTPGATHCGEITPEYMLLPSAALRQVRDLILGCGASLKVVLLLRDPIDRFYSGLRHAQRSDPKLDPERDFVIELQNPKHLQRTRYDQILARLDKVFTPDQVVIHFTEGLFTEDGVRALCHDLGLDFHPGRYQTRQNATSEAAHLGDEQVAAAMAALAPVYRACRQRFAARLPPGWRA